MSTYAIGDVQGCFDDLKQLLADLKFNEATDTLWFVGDLVNRGDKSLETLRFIKNLPNKICVLGNHDIHLLAVYYGVRALQPKDTLQSILDAPDCNELIQFLREQPLFHWDKKLGYAMVHAGIHSSWSFADAVNYSNLVSSELKSDNIKPFLSEAFGNEPNYWDESLKDMNKMRSIINAFTRTRLTTPNEHQVFNYKGTYKARPEGTEAWFNLRRWQHHEKLIFGHWAALGGKTPHPNLFAIDTGCVWGNELTGIKINPRLHN